MDLVRATATWAWDYIQHVVLMFYWFWIPAVLVVGALSVRYRPLLESITLKAQRGPAAFWASVGWGVTSGAGRRTGVETAERLWADGLPDHVVLAFLVASQNLVLYSLVLLTVLIGVEFGLGVLLSGLAMMGLVRLAAPERSPRLDRPRPREEGIRVQATPETWRALLTSARGWGHIMRAVGGYVRDVGPSLLGGLILGALILAVDTAGFWIFPKWMGDESVAASAADAVLAPLVSIALFLAPGGNLIVVSSIWKTWTLTYAGLISFVLVGVLNPLTIRTLLRHYGTAHGWRLVLTLYIAAALSGLIVAGSFAALGIEVTHVPWLRALVDRLMMIFPGTMLGAPGGMRGM